MSLLSTLALLGLQISSISAAAILPRASTTSTAPDPAKSYAAIIQKLNTTGALQQAYALIPDVPYTIEQKAEKPDARIAAINLVREHFVYGPPVGGGPLFPNGTLGDIRVATDVKSIQNEAVLPLQWSSEDNQIANSNKADYNGLKTLDDYNALYSDNNWENTLPNGPFPGAITNYTQDLFFSMERLANAPYSVRRLSPANDTLQIPIDEDTAKKIAEGSTLDELFHDGRLFYIDYRDQKDLEKTNVTGGACDAYFYINNAGDFMPLAIRTGVGSNLVYTPLDTPNEWLLAKILYSSNDFWFTQWNHLAATHEPAHIGYMAALRTLSIHHPVLAVLNRFMYQVFGIQPLAESVLFAPGAAVDQIFPHTGLSGKSYTTNLYKTRGGRVQANYFQTELRERGLLDSTFGPALKHFPFFEDAQRIHSALYTFFSTMVHSYYACDEDVMQDKEIQAWVKEAQGPAEVIDFPDLNDRFSLTQLLTHYAHLTSTSHAGVNINELLDISLSIPFHSAALYKPLPSAKGEVENVADWLPPYDKVINQFSVASIFARRNFIGTNRTLMHVFDHPKMLAQLNNETQAAADEFKSTMAAFSKEVKARKFDMNGLSQGMPFVWQALDPDVIPYSVST